MNKNNTTCVQAHMINIYEDKYALASFINDVVFHRNMDN